MATSSPSSPLDLASLETSIPGNNSKDFKKPFKIRSELLVPTRLAPKAQLLLHTRSLAIQVIAHEVFLLVLACAKCFAAADKEPPRIGILGGGNVGTTVVMTLLANGYQAELMALSTRQPDRISRCEVLRPPSALPMFQMVPRYYDNARLARESDILVFCMPPSQLKSVTIQIRHALAVNVDAPPLVISALCGVTHNSLSKACGSQAVVRIQPDVSKIASKWHEKNDSEETTKNVAGQFQTPPESNERDQQPLPLRMAAEAIAPKRDDVRNLFEAFTLFGRRAWSEDTDIDALANVLFGDKCEMVIATLEQEQQKMMRVKTPLVVPRYPAEWEQDLIELQAQLAAHALQQTL
ncbi:hypothetical protein PHMEG_00032235 [Phytophthora megakarya]|uniref:Pyrroline-5-carboxylate reductase catalytic N-terminal domain-containing protein n=1 Tax=Phytophthora megakarya TaxID=4795 RepID=A0A225UWH1_9STRA|nr:hypothetical protein PHMEG_00032235 [Phytophthora megakarya]